MCTRTVHQISSDEDEVEELDLASRVKMRFQSKEANLAICSELTSAKSETPIFSQSGMFERTNFAIPSQTKLQELKLNVLSERKNEIIDDMQEFASKNYKEHEISDDDDLPDINDITVSPKNYIEPDIVFETILTPQITCESVSSKLPTSSKEAKALEKELKKREREKKKEEKDLIKKKKGEEKLLKRAFRPGECLKYISVQIDRHLLEIPEGSVLVSKLLEVEIQYQAVEQIVQNSVTFFRLDPISGEEQEEKEIIVIIKMEDFLNQVYNQIYGVGYHVGNTLISNCKYWREMTGISRITMVVCGVDDYFKKQKSTISKNFRENVLKDDGHTLNSRRPKKRKKDEDVSNLSQVTRIDVETALVALQVELEVNSRFFETPSKIADFVAQVSKAVAEKPFKLEKAQSNFSWYAEGSSVNCVKIDKSGVGLLKLWHQQLRQFNNVGPEAAQAIAKKYPSPQSLLKAYRSISEAEGLKLLADIPVRRGVGVLVNTRKIGPELSSKIYKFLMSEDPNVLL